MVFIADRQINTKFAPNEHKMTLSAQEDTKYEGKEYKKGDTVQVSKIEAKVLLKTRTFKVLSL